MARKTREQSHAEERHHWEELFKWEQQVIGWVLKAREIYGTTMIPMPLVVLSNRMTTTFGSCRFEEGKQDIIKLNAKLCRAEPDKMRDETVPHEVAHMVAWRVFKHRGHGRPWRHVMIQFGLPANRCGSSPTAHSLRRRKARPHMYQCGCMTHMLTTQMHRNILRGRYKRCVHCYQRIHYLGSTDQAAA